MFKVEEDGTILITRGDTGFFRTSCEINVDGHKGKYMLSGQDKITFSVKVDPNDANTLIQKEYTAVDQLPNGDILVELNSADTENLQFMTYKYDIQLDAVLNGKTIRDTYITVTPFIVTAEITKN